MATSVTCKVQMFRSGSKPQVIRFNPGKELSFAITGSLGGNSISPIAADLLDLASTIFQVERLIRGRGRINKPIHFDLNIKLRQPKAWSNKAVEAVESILQFQGNATWKINIDGGLKNYNLPEYTLAEKRGVKQVMLLSGGMDSTCGAISMSATSKQTQLVSFHSTHQKTVQLEIANELGFDAPTQWRLNWDGNVRPGGTFYYRSFLFLSIAAVVANSWNVREILQFENGILASGIPPSSAWVLTKHAHPKLHRLAETLFSELFGNEWHISNPFILSTKRMVFENAIQLVGRKRAHLLIGKTETCWHHWSNRIPGGKKTPGKPCGVCIPCIIRRSALPAGGYVNKYDLIGNPKVQEDETYGYAFQSYAEFVRRILSCKNEYEFYALVSSDFDLIEQYSSVSLKELYKLFMTFAKEFKTAYKIK